jgi:hypothetical protein
MIKNITDDLRQFAKANVSIGKLYGLFSKFLDLCAPLIKPNQGMLELDVRYSRLVGRLVNQPNIQTYTAVRAIKCCTFLVQGLAEQPLRSGNLENHSQLRDGTTVRCGSYLIISLL